MLSKSIFLARPLENHQTFWFLPLTAHNLCCLPRRIDECAGCQGLETSLSDALTFALGLEPCGSVSAVHNAIDKHQAMT